MLSRRVEENAIGWGGRSRDDAACRPSPEEKGDGEEVGGVQANDGDGDDRVEDVRGTEDDEGEEEEDESADGDGAEGDSGGGVDLLC